MIKYFEFDSMDEYGPHIIPINTDRELVKTASSYSPELAKVISSMKRQPNRYYVVINAIGSYEYWGCNRNGDAFPEEALSHASLRTDMGSENDYGHKTFEYYGRLYMHHANKDPRRSFGEVVFAYWNPQLHRIELIVAMDVDKTKDIIDAIEAGEPVSASMGTKVPFDYCSICENKARIRDNYCQHLKNHMREIVDRDMARRWSIETGKNIIPGMQVFAWNRKPRFFDISRVYVGADRTSYFLGKAASHGHTIFAIDLAESYGVTDSDFDKMAMVRKSVDIDKEIGGNLGPGDIDGSVEKIDMPSIIDRATLDKTMHAVRSEPEIPRNLLNAIGRSTPIEQIVSTMLGIGIQPKPREFQRIILIRIGAEDVADKLDDADINFGDLDNEPAPLDVFRRSNPFSDSLARILIPYLSSRSALPSFLGPRVNALEKVADEQILQPLNVSPANIIANNEPLIGALTGLAALYAGLRMKAMGVTPSQLAQIFIDKPWLRNLIGGGVLFQLYTNMGQMRDSPLKQTLMTPAGYYANALQDTNFSGHLKQSSVNVPNALGSALIGGVVGYPMSYIINSYNIKRAQSGRRPLINRIISPQAGIVGGAIGGGAAAILGDTALNKVRKALGKIK